MIVSVPYGSLMTFFFFLVFLVAAIYGWHWPYMAKFMPVYFVAIPGIILCLVQLYHDLITRDQRAEVYDRGPEMDEALRGGLDAYTEFVRTVAFLAWFAGAAFAMWLLGIVLALPLFVFLYSSIEGCRWQCSLILATGVYAFLAGLFEYLLEIRWPAGALFG